MKQSSALARRSGPGGRSDAVQCSIGLEKPERGLVGRVIGIRGTQLGRPDPDPALAWLAGEKADGDTDFRGPQTTEQGRQALDLLQAAAGLAYAA